MSDTEARSSDPVEGANVRELRLAIVLYGGASLAIYMHGTTKEVQRLVKASALADRGVAAAAPSERVYGELLAELARRNPAGVRTRVVVDVVAGTSAGGINGVYLSKAIAHNRSQDSLRDLWLERGDIKVLLRGPSWLPTLLKAPVLLAGAVKKPVLKGDAIAQWMYDALHDMDAGGSQPPELQTLMPPSHPLELFVTVTDFYGYRRNVMIADPTLIGERAHRHVLSFRFDGAVDQFDEAHNGALAFSARTTMSFPGAFPPISLSSFEAAVAKDAGDVSQVLPGLFRIYELSGSDPHATFFIDGGVLDNKPFGYAIAAIKRRSAESEVERRLLFLEPDPGGGGGAAPGGSSPSPIATVLASISGLPREEPVLDDILEVNRQNDRVRRIRDIIETSFDPIAARIEEIVGTGLGRLAQEQSPAELAGLSARINEDAKAAAGFAYATYIRSKVSGVVDGFARTICRVSDFPDDSNQAVFVRAVVRSWGGTRLFRDENGRQAPVDDLVAFLRRFDLAYGARRLRFVIDGLSWWYADAGKPGYPTRAQLDQGKKALYDARDTLLDAMDGRKLLTDITGDVLAVFAQAPIDDCDRETARARGLRRRPRRRARPPRAGIRRRARREARRFRRGALPAAVRAVRELGARTARRPAGPLPGLPVLGRPALSAPDRRRRRRARRDPGRADEPARHRVAAAARSPQGEARRPREDALRGLLRPRRPRERLPVGAPGRGRAPDRARPRSRISPTRSARPGAARRSRRSSRRRTARSRTPSRSSSTRAASPARSSACIAVSFGAQWIDGSRPRASCPRNS